VCANLIYEDRRRISENDMSVTRQRKFGVDHLQAPELASHLWLVLHEFLAELGGVAICDQRDGAEVVVL